MKGSAAGAGDAGARAPGGVEKRAFHIPEHAALRELRRTLARGGCRPSTGGRPRTMRGLRRSGRWRTLLVLLDEYKRRVERGEACRLVERERGREAGRFVIEIVIDGAAPEGSAVPPSSGRAPR